MQKTITIPASEIHAGDYFRPTIHAEWRMVTQVHPIRNATEVKLYVSGRLYYCYWDELITIRRED